MDAVGFMLLLALAVFAVGAAASVLVGCIAIAIGRAIVED